MDLAQTPRTIFISYRRDDSSGESGRLCDDLTQAFGAENVFMDVTGISPGLDFRAAIDENVKGCGVFLAVIGPTWVSITNDQGERRLDDPDDFVRLEVASALKRGVPVIPVLVRRAEMPKEAQLPEEIREFAYRNAVELTASHWQSDVADFIDNALRQYVHVDASKATQTVHASVPVQLPAPNPVKRSPVRLSKRTGFAAAAVAVVVLSALGWIWADSRPSRAAVQAQVTLPYNTIGIYPDGAQFDAQGGVDQRGFAYHPFDKLMTPGVSRIQFRDRNQTWVTMGPPGVNDVLESATPVTITLPKGAYSTLFVLGTAVNGSQTNQMFTVNYDGALGGSQTYTQSMSDWAKGRTARYPNEVVYITQTYRNRSDGSQQQNMYSIYGYSFALDPSKNVKSLTLPGNANVVVFAVTLLP